jgi:hypothetical protein
MTTGIGLCQRIKNTRNKSEGHWEEFMERWAAEMDEERLGVVEAKDEDGAVEAAAQRFHVGAR